MIAGEPVSATERSMSLDVWSVGQRVKAEELMEGGLIWLSIMGGIIALALIFLAVALVQRRRRGL